MRLAPVDARMLWTARSAASDQFLLFAFDDTGVPEEQVCVEVLVAARAVGRLNVAAREVPGHLDYPEWTAHPASSAQVVAHRLADTAWAGLLTALGSVMADQVDPGEAPWRVHVFSGIVDPRDPARRLRVAVLQVSHALVDGRGATALARQLFGDPPDPAAPARETGARMLAVRGAARLPAQVAGLVVGGARAYRLSRREGAPSGTPPVVPLPVNRPAGVRRALRTVTVDRSQFRGRVTVGAVAAIGDALLESGLLESGLVESDPVVELAVARDRVPGQANNFFMAGIRTRTDLVGAARHDAIAAAVRSARERDRQPARRAARRAESFTPAMLMHWAATGFEPPEGVGAVAGHTVVSSVDRGTDDLFLAGGRVRLTAGFPALSTVHGLTHGVHGIGDTVTVSVLADPDAIRVDEYVAALRAAIGGSGGATAR